LITTMHGQSWFVDPVFDIKELIVSQLNEGMGEIYENRKRL